MDLKKAADDATKPAPEGDHIVEITKAVSANASTSGNPMYKVTGRIVEGVAQGKTVFTNINVTLDSAFAMSLFFKRMAALGFDDNYFGAGPSHEQICNDLVGRRAIWVLGIRQWQGQDRNEMTDVKPLSGPLASGPVGPMVGTAGAYTTPAAGATPPTPQMPAAPPTPQMPSTPQATAPSGMTPPPVPFDV